LAVLAAVQLLPLVSYALHYAQVMVDEQPAPAAPTLSLHDALPISARCRASHPRPEGPLRSGHQEQSRPALQGRQGVARHRPTACASKPAKNRRPRSHRAPASHHRSEEHTSELQSRENLVCRLLLEKKKKKYIYIYKNR